MSLESSSSSSSQSPVLKCDISFHERPLIDEYFLFEADDHLMEAVTQGGELVLRGSRDANSVMCTASQTYSIKQVENSNMCCLLPPNSSSTCSLDLSPSRIIQGLVKCHYSLAPCVPALHSLQHLLLSSPFDDRHDRIVSLLHRTRPDLYQQILSTPLPKETLEHQEDEEKSSLESNLPPFLGQRNEKSSHDFSLPLSVEYLDPADQTPDQVQDDDLIDFDGERRSKLVKRVLTVTRGPETLDVGGRPVPYLSCYAFTELQQLVQAADMQLVKGLVELGAFRVEGRFTVLSDSFLNYHAHTLALVLGSMDWSLCVDVKALVEEMIADNLSPLSIFSSLLYFADSDSSQIVVEAFQSFVRGLNPQPHLPISLLNEWLGLEWRFNPAAYLPTLLTISPHSIIQRSIITQLVEHASHSDSKTSSGILLSTLKKSILIDLPTCISQSVDVVQCLAGIAIIDDPVFNPDKGFKEGFTAADLFKENTHSPEARVSLWRHDSLSFDLQTRFDQLFTHRTKWTATAISPYIKQWTNDKLSLDQLLLQNARAILVGPKGKETSIYTWR